LMNARRNLWIFLIIIKDRYSSILIKSAGITAHNIDAYY
jgi:hypothetical protein